MNLDELIQQVTRLRQDVDGLIKPENGRWRTWTPTVTQSVSVTVTINHARYIVISDSVTLECRLTVTGAGTIGTNIIIGGLPFTILNASGYDSMGAGVVVNTGTTVYAGTVIAASATTVAIQAHSSTGVIGTTPSFALANTDVISFTAVYERA